MQDDELTLNRPKHVKLSEKTARFALQAGDFVTSLTGNIGRVAKIDVNHLPAALNQRVARLRVRDNAALDADFLHLFLLSKQFRENLIERGHGTAQQNVSPKDLASIELPLPMIDGQRELVEKATRIKDVSQQLSHAATRKLTALNELRRSLLHRAFTGQLTSAGDDTP